MCIKDEQYVFLKTVFKFCYEDFCYYNDYKKLKQFKNSIIEQAFEDKQYKNALMQFFKDKKSIITVLSFVTTVIWNNNKYKI
jgi:hypothetical protein